ncbi:pyocin knob domain-containing protein [Thorsellia kenyensis]|uniref:Pyocin knob domain-containing protein n=1 Tax=Thorsellia kenyensis TaxID=1549888 RepID=A0ABV6C7T7_9GAMM
MWYRTGTITLKKGTTKVLGVGTKWTDKLSNVEAGQPLIVNGNIYEITEVISDTELYIKESALADATATPYVIMSVVYGSLGDVALKASKAFAHYQEQMDVFDMMYTGTQTFKVTKPDGTEIEMYPYSMLSIDLAKLNQTLQTVATHATNAKTSETNAKNSATSAATSATSASSSATTATASANAASSSATTAKASETNAAKSATAAASSATNASTSASNAKTSETKAKEYADSVNANSLLTKEDNLKSVANLAEAQANLQVFRQMPDLTANINLDSLTKTTDYGVYACLEPNTATPENNYPIKLAGALIVSRSLEGSCLQEYTTNTGRKFIRGRAGGQWLAWTEYLNSKNNLSELTDKITALKNLGAMPNEITAKLVDINTLKVSGFYNISANSPNWLGSSGGVLLVVAHGTVGYITQIAYLNGSVYVRYAGGSGVWGEWSELASLSRPNAFTGKQTINGNLVVNQESFVGFSLVEGNTKDGSIIRFITNADKVEHSHIGFLPKSPDLRIYCKNGGMSLSLKTPMLINNNEVLTVGNAGVFNGIGSSVSILLPNSIFNVGDIYTGSEIGAESSFMQTLSGRWRCTSSDRKTFGSTILTLTSFTRIS